MRRLLFSSFCCGLTLALAAPAVAQFANADLGGVVKSADGQPKPPASAGPRSPRPTAATPSTACGRATTP